MSRAKQKNHQHAIDKAGQELLRSQLPAHWELRAYQPDYGLDFALEVFSPPDSQRNSETLGEHIFIQLKSTEEASLAQLKVYGRGNVEKQPEILRRDDLVATVEVARISIETPELVTIERMGTGVPVLLVIADLSRSQCYFVCLNDYIDKILIPRYDNYSEKLSRTIHVPTRNTIGDRVIGIAALRWYAKRPKMFAAFQRFVYQYVELQYEGGPMNTPDMARYFARRLSQYDFWDDTEMWEIVGYYGSALKRFLETGDPGLMNRIVDSLADIEDEDIRAEIENHHRNYEILELWRGLSILARQYEDVSREWFLPTALGLAASYPYGS
ncbi:MAG TPA: DUF4365 domain-containing protein [Rhodothermales bacterium]|nr:DUF4365 domain-containing protein [Rhodothermales bacterium]